MSWDRLAQTVTSWNPAAYLEKYLEKTDSNDRARFRTRREYPWKL